MAQGVIEEPFSHSSKRCVWYKNKTLKEHNSHEETWWWQHHAVDWGCTIDQK